MIEWLLPLELVSPNIQEHWTKKHKRNKRNAALLTHYWTLEPLKPQSPCVVRLDRHYSAKSKAMDEEDNLRMAFKPIKDTIADLLVPGLAPGRADDGHGITWEYAQTRAKQKVVKITITPTQTENYPLSDLRLSRMNVKQFDDMEKPENITS